MLPKQPLQTLAFALGAVATAALVAGGVVYGVQRDAALPGLELGVEQHIRDQLARGESEAALETLSVATRIAFGDPGLLRAYLNVAEATQDEAARLRALESWAALQPRNSGHRAALLSALMPGLGPAYVAEPGYAVRTASALRHAQALATLEPESPRSHAYLGLALLARNAANDDPADAQSAAEELERAIALGEEGRVARRALALARQRSGR